jgi:hypothetical protein
MFEANNFELTKETMRDEMDLIDAKNEAEEEVNSMANLIDEANEKYL